MILKLAKLTNGGILKAIYIAIAIVIYLNEIW